MDFLSWAELAQSTSAALIAAMTTDAWAQLRTRTAELVGRGDPAGQDSALAVLDRAGEVPDDQLRDDLANLLVARLIADPDLAGELDGLRAAARAAAPGSTGVVQHAVAAANSTIIQAGRDVTR